MSSSPFSRFLQGLATSPIIGNLFSARRLSVSAPDVVVPDSEVPVTVTGVPSGAQCVVAIGTVATKTVTAPASGPIDVSLTLAALVAPGEYTVTATLPASNRTASCDLTVVRNQQTYTKQK
ncbi:hypothetical protein [Aeromicrobium ginsengisoli]|uniref:Uncharacterized protein n=1 Tax=Aeromicrobium ginsengisoli TaxID=363867 RepID=A0A5M4FAX6_9ACTN|nr:hypothetical protein [Aeromicrobium ginsengisoli]KAA1395491.1 hypothetical protein ESP70_015145 [Aeromicrobium ginsengisoli]